MPEPAARPMRMHGRKMLDALTEAGIIRDGDYVRRVIIDVSVDLAVVVHVERYGDTRLLDLVHALNGIEIERREQART
jgi:hypothetical protein